MLNEAEERVCAAEGQRESILEVLEVLEAPESPEVLEVLGSREPVETVFAEEHVVDCEESVCAEEHVEEVEALAERVDALAD